MSTAAWITLAVLTLANLWFNWWISLRQKRYHGIFRLVSFECIILLVILQIPVWFRDPFIWYQVFSWILLTGSLLVACLGFYTFYGKGKPSDRMEETTRLIKTGLYRYIRHPLYLSLVLLGFGVLMKDPEGIQIGLSILNFIALYLTARIEEGEMNRKFGQEYADYMRESKMFIPFIL
jgi:protein-S-isoprenylcysteine O-methyltransferase Ste14